MKTRRGRLRPGQKLVLILSSFGYSDFYVEGRERERVQIPAGWVLHLTNISEWFQQTLGLPRQSMAVSNLIPRRGRFLTVEGQEIPLGPTARHDFVRPVTGRIEVTVIGRANTSAQPRMGWA